ncbi:RING finger protein 151-like [Hydractinia symbiolongicarpus]|uniref:RING finger protein 151-like n=1 Tax=Hydractinia symbiolongicarpus TaxID=13093 RepID=UPI00254CC0AE|nr:RING finger protein 151-like [Hydractinia symbiolongicarpus]XP_057311631.1 RING finger protein 151-like [Hydractinia symbiolongicarpus]
MNDVTQRYFLNPDAVSKHLYCSICQDVFNEPQRAPCGHSFCKLCIQQWLRQSKTCPEDRKPLTTKQLHYDFILANIIGDQMVGCPFRTKGCDFVDKLEKLASHRKSCTFNPLNLPAFMKENEEPKSFILESNGDDDKLPTPAKPSLKMRLFCDENKRDLLRSVFESRENKPSSSADRREEKFNNVWLEKSKCAKTRNSKRVNLISIDDSFDELL